MLIALVAKYGLQIRQNGCENIFILNEKLEEEIYIEQPKGFVVLVKKRKSVNLLSHSVD